MVMFLKRVRWAVLLAWVCQVFCVNDLDFVLGFGFVVALGFAVVVGFGDGVPGKGAFWSAPLD